MPNSRNGTLALFSWLKNSTYCQSFRYRGVTISKYKISGIVHQILCCGYSLELYQPDRLNGVLRCFQQYFSHIKATANII